MIAIPSREITLISSNANATPAVEYDKDTIYDKDAEVYIKELTPGDPSSYIGVIFKSVVDNNDKNPVEDIQSWTAIDYLEYEEGRVYPENATVKVAGTKYLSQEIDNDTSPLSLNSKWSDIGKDNANACFDYYFTTSTRKVGEPLVFTISFNMADTLSMFGLFASKVKVEQLDNNGNVIVTNVILHTDPASISDFATYLLFGSVGGVAVEGEDIGTLETELVDTSSITDFASYLQFLSCEYETSLMYDLIISDAQQLRITIEPKPKHGLLLAEVATVVVGEKIDLGCTVNSASIQRIALTPPKRDKWGEIDFKGDDYVKIYKAKAQFETLEFDQKDNIVETLFNQPAVYMLTDNAHKSFNTFGLMQDSETTLDHPSETELPIKIESFKYKKIIKEC